MKKIYFQLRICSHCDKQKMVNIAGYCSACNKELNKHKLCLCGAKATINDAWCNTCHPDTGFYG